MNSLDTCYYECLNCKWWRSDGMFVCEYTNRFTATCSFRNQLLFIEIRCSHFEHFAENVIIDFALRTIFLGEEKIIRNKRLVSNKSQKKKIQTYKQFFWAKSFKDFCRFAFFTTFCSMIFTVWKNYVAINSIQNWP